MKYFELSCVIFAPSSVSFFLKVMVKMEGSSSSFSQTPLANGDYEGSHKILPILRCMSYFLWDLKSHHLSQWKF